jgi:hypothetical protein
MGYEMENGINFTTEFFPIIFGEEVLYGTDLQMFLNSFKEESGFETNDTDLTEARLYGLPVKIGKEKKAYVAGFGIYLPKTIEKLHYLQFFSTNERKIMFFDSHIALSEVVEIGKFLSTKKANQTQRLINYFLAAFMAYLTGRKYVLVGTFYINTSYEYQLRRICPHVTF